MTTINYAFLDNTFKPKTLIYDDFQTEWHDLSCRERMTMSPLERFRIAMRRTKILELFPKYKRLDALDHLNQAAGVEDIFDLGDNVAI